MGNTKNQLLASLVACAGTGEVCAAAVAGVASATNSSPMKIPDVSWKIPSKNGGFSHGYVSLQECIQDNQKNVHLPSLDVSLFHFYVALTQVSKGDSHILFLKRICGTI